MIKFYLNGKLCEVSSEHASLMLSDYLRYEHCLTGTKVVCAEGDCGACSILRFNPLLKGEEAQNFTPVNSCILPVSLLHGQHILTVESLAKEDEKLHQAQKCMRECHASQCGFCTPGFVMALAGLSEEKISKKDFSISEKEGKNALTGNLCRCTGYNTIVDAATSMDLKKEQSLKERYHTGEIQKHLQSICEEDLLIETQDYTFYAPTSIANALEYLNTHDEVQIIASATDLGVVHNKRRTKLMHLLSLHLVKEAYEIKEEQQVVRVGARVSLSEFRHFLKGKCDEYADYLNIFASPQIKNNATLVGNIANASPIGDNAPVLLSLDATVELISSQGTREVKLSEFFLDYKKLEMKKGELIQAVSFQLPSKSSLKLFKNSIRKDLDIATINLAVHAKVNKTSVEEIFIGAGGIAAIPLRLKKTESFLKGKDLNAKNIQDAIAVAQSEFKPISDVRATASYRRVVFANTLSRLLGGLA